MSQVVDGASQPTDNACGDGRAVFVFSNPSQFEIMIIFVNEPACDFFRLRYRLKGQVRRAGFNIGSDDVPELSIEY